MTAQEALRGIRWYLREVSGEADYDKYLASARSHNCTAPVLSRRDFEGRKMKDRDANPQARCC